MVAGMESCKCYFVVLCLLWCVLVIEPVYAVSLVECFWQQRMFGKVQLQMLFMSSFIIIEYLEYL